MVSILVDSLISELIGSLTFSLLALVLPIIIEEEDVVLFINDVSLYTSLEKLLKVLLLISISDASLSSSIVVGALSLIIFSDIVDA